MAAAKPATLSRIIPIVIVRLALATVPARDRHIERLLSLLASLLMILALLDLASARLRVGVLLDSLGHRCGGFDYEAYQRGAVSWDWRRRGGDMSLITIRMLHVRAVLDLSLNSQRLCLSCRLFASRNPATSGP